MASRRLRRPHAQTGSFTGTRFITASSVAGAEIWPLERSVGSGDAAHVTALLDLCVRRSFTASLHPYTSEVMLSRLGELGARGLSLSKLLGKAVEFNIPNASFHFSATCRPVLAALEANGKIGLRDVLLWIELDCGSVLAALDELTSCFPNLLLFDRVNIQNLDVMHRKLCRLSSLNQLTWVEIAYFARLEELSINEVISIAEDLAAFGISIPDPATQPVNIELTEQEISGLTSFFKNMPGGLHHRVPLRVRPYRYWQRDTPSLLVAEQISSLRRLLPTNESRYQLRPTDLDRLQGILLSKDLDDEIPYFRKINLLQLYSASRHGEFKGFAKALEVARSIDQAFVVNNIPNIDTAILERFDQLSLTDKAASFVHRIFDAVDRGHSVSAWDLALAATAGSIDLNELNPILEVLNCLGGDVRSCLDFVSKS
jgi:hypothetical protein